MNYISYFSPPLLQNETLLPGFPSPFSNIPQPIARKAALELQHRLSGLQGWQHEFDAPDGGKMFGVLVVRDGSGQVGYLAAFSGMLAGEWDLPGFVPPLFDQQMIDDFMPDGEAQLDELEAQLDELQYSPAFALLNDQLVSLQQQRDIALDALTAAHRARKALRQTLRATADSAGREGVLIRLSFESQQDKRERRSLLGEWRDRLAPVEQQVTLIEQQLMALKQQRSRLSSRLHRKVFKAYRLSNRLGEEKSVSEFFDERLPPGGTGDCAAPKLIQYAHQQGLEPVALAEFWWGSSPQSGIRHHGNFYPACRGKCQPILSFMLKGLDLQPRQFTSLIFDDPDAPAVVYEDEHLLVVNKPSGLLSVPGKEVVDSVQTRLRQRYPELEGLLLVHRLDMSTSGLLLVAKYRPVHKDLQQQFIKRTVEKRYVAVLSKRLPEWAEDGAVLDEGTIELPLRVDFDDRPRQMVCYDHGRMSVTYWQVIERGKDTTRIYFYPHTGRTHQLRLHAAHQLGLNAPIYGDELYGEAQGRLLLHAERLCFDHPVSGERIEMVVAAPF